MRYQIPEPVKQLSGPIVIYGTGEIAEQYYEELSALSMQGQIAFFMNTSPTITEFKGKPVHALEEVQQIAQRGGYTYLIASYGTAMVLAENLYAIGITNSTVHFPVPVALSEEESFLPLLIKPVTHICFYPPVEDSAALEDLQARVHWYLPNYNDLTILLPEAANCSKGELASNLNECDLLLVWNKANLADEAIREYKFKMACVDPKYLVTRDADIYRRLYYWTLSAQDKKGYVEQSESNFASMLKRNADKKQACVFGTGPSLQTVYQYKFDDYFKVVVNGAVKSKELLAHIEPDILATSDALNFSYCKFGEVFRQNAMSLMQQDKVYTVIPDICVPLMSVHYPEMKHKFIGLAMSSDLYHFPATDKLSVKETWNVVTRFAIPIASAVAQEIYIMGCDGTDKFEEKVWEHSKNVEHDELLKVAYEAHTSHFEMHTSLKAYFDNHCRIMNELLAYGETCGKKYHSITASHIPALATRYDKLLEQQMNS
ncbi:hypothetical protein [Paenibacillus sp. OV219]|uniref:hypothetical protein n=1 Tax=Paenibacillus sp. OV219 TaxID=1884377 RepID=UPI0008B87DF9|nr:hypothetical protein [Paenibacillus sp. OV219]SEN65168.1 hypothetical protein SAMN05518847_103406 [Paenibacillus sp. OV219]